MKIVSRESLRVTTLSGAAIVFEAGIPTEISQEIGLIALQMGATEYKEGGAKVEAGDSETPADSKEPSLTGIVSLDLVTALEKLMDEGDPENFKADGSPKASVVNKAMGKTIDSDTRDAAWEALLNS
jgi:hypothetical protein